MSIDNTIVNVALPQLRSDLGASLQSLQWVVGGYVLVLGSGLLLAGSLADRVGRRRVFLTGIAAFTLFSALSSLAPSEDWLIAFRAAQGAGAAMMTPVALAIIASVFTERSSRARAIGKWGAVSGIGIAIGPVLGGFLVDTLGWRSVFWINVPIGVVAFVLAVVVIPESRSNHPRAIDPLGQVFVVGLLGFSAFAIIQLPVSGVAIDTVTAVVLAIASITGLLLWERSRREPLVDLRLFRDGLFSRCFLTAVLSFFAFAGLLFATTFYLQDARGVSATQAGLITLPLALAIVFAGPLSGRLVSLGKTRTALLAGGSLIAVAGVLVAAVDELSVWVFAVPLFLFGAGFGLLNDPINVAAVSEVPPSRSAVGAGIMSSGKQIGQLLGVSVVGALLAVDDLNGQSPAPSLPLADIILCTTLAWSGLLIVMLTARLRMSTNATTGQLATRSSNG